MKRLHFSVPITPLHICAVLLTFGGIIFTVFAVPLYTPGETLEPACAPGATDCTVSTGSSSSLEAADGDPTNAVSVDNDGDVGIGTTSPTSTFHVEGSLSLQQTTITGNTTLDNTHNVVLANPSGNITITLPAAASHTDKTYYIKKIDADNDEVTIDGNASETIDGTTTLVLYIQWFNLT